MSTSPIETSNPFGLLALADAAIRLDAPYLKAVVEGTGILVADEDPQPAGGAAGGITATAMDLIVQSLQKTPGKGKKNVKDVKEVKVIRQLTQAQKARGLKCQNVATTVQGYCKDHKEGKPLQNTIRYKMVGKGDTEIPEATDAEIPEATDIEEETKSKSFCMAFPHTYVKLVDCIVEKYPQFSPKYSGKTEVKHAEELEAGFLKFAMDVMDMTKEAAKKDWNYLLECLPPRGGLVVSGVNKRTARVDEVTADKSQEIPSDIWFTSARAWGAILLEIVKHLTELDEAGEITDMYWGDDAKLRECMQQVKDDTEGKTQREQSKKRKEADPDAKKEGPAKKPRMSDAEKIATLANNNTPEQLDAKLEKQQETLIKQQETLIKQQNAILDTEHEIMMIMKTQALRKSMLPQMLKSLDEQVAANAANAQKRKAAKKGE